MELAPMKYKDFTWPHNPRIDTVEYRRSMGTHKVPFGRYHLQDLGPTRRVMKGEGEFVGPGALIHPVWQSSNAYFVELTLAQEPRKDYVKYTFTFWEGYDGYAAYARTAPADRGSGDASGGGGSTAQPVQGTEVWHTVAKGENLWKISRDYGVSLTEVIALNPQLKNPNLIYPGEKVRVK